QEVPDFDLILVRSEESEPRSAEGVPAPQGRAKPKTKLAFVGHKGRYVGVMAVFRNGEGLDVRWDLVRLGPEFASPADAREIHPIVRLLEGYTEKLKNDDFLGRVPKLVHPLAGQLNNKNVKYVGSAACKECHKTEYETWDESRHSGAYDTLSQH